MYRVYGRNLPTSWPAIKALCAVKAAMAALYPTTHCKFLCDVLYKKQRKFSSVYSLWISVWLLLDWATVWFNRKHGSNISFKLKAFTKSSWKSVHLILLWLTSSYLRLVNLKPKFMKQSKVFKNLVALCSWNSILGRSTRTVKKYERFKFFESLKVH